MTNTYPVSENTFEAIADAAEQMIVTYPTRTTIAIGIGMLHSLQMLHIEPEITKKIETLIVDAAKKLGTLYSEEMAVGFQLIKDQQTEMETRNG